MSARPAIVTPADFDATLPQHRSPQRRLGKYEVTGVLGEGAMGIVYRAVDPVIRRVVAIKVIRAPLLAPLADDLAAAQRFRNEARAAGRLNHPNIVSVHDFVEADGEALIVMEHVEGESLLELTRAGVRLPLPDALAIVGQLLDALDSAHAQNVWHRDIKPANLLITPQGRLKVTDFGIARIESSQVTQHGKVVGSPGYMAPERYTDMACDQRVDIFSAGVLLYELLTGAAPYRGSPSSVMNQVLNGTLPAPSALPIEEPPPPAFDAVLAKALARDPGQRYADALSMREALVAANRGALRPAVQRETLLRLRAVRPEAATMWLPRQAAASASVSAAASAPVAATAPAVAADAIVTVAPAVPLLAPGAARWEPKTLDRLVALLVPHIGPVAVVLVRRAAAGAEHAGALLARLAGTEALGADERRCFVDAARAVLGIETAPAPAPDERSAEPPVLGDTPLAPEVIERAQTWLTTQLGPIARVIVQRAGAGVDTREAFYARLADRLAGELDRRTLLAELWKLGPRG